MKTVGNKSIPLIAFAGNDAYAKGIAMAVSSVVQNTKGPVRFVVLSDGISQQGQDFIKEAAGQSSINFIPVVKERFDGFRRLRGALTTYMRLLLPEILLDEAWVLYSDADVLWLADVQEFWNERDEAYYGIATPDCRESAEFDQGVYGEYFCAGIMMMNLNKWREGRVSQSCEMWLREHPETRFYDQSAINRILRGKVKLIGKEWNVYVGELRNSRRKMKALHFAGHLPWKFGVRRNRLDATRMLWFRKYAKMRGVSVWTALREFSPIWKILLSRLVECCESSVRS